MNEIQGELERRLQHLEEALQRQDNAIIELKALLIRAADAMDELLVDEEEALFELCPDWSTPRYGLIAELRKAAE